MGRFLRYCFTETTLLCLSFGDVMYPFWYFWTILSYADTLTRCFYHFFTNGNARCEREWSLPRVNPSHPQTNHWTEMVQTGSNTFAAKAPVKICETVIVYDSVCFVLSVVLSCYCGMSWVAWMESFDDLLSCKTWSSDERILFGI